MMKSYQRTLDLKKLLSKNSFFLFGPRATGKSYWIRKTLKGPKVQIFDLLDTDVYGRFLRRPRQLAEEIQALTSLVVIDEIQKLPALLDEVHRLLETRKIRFLLTGSSARQLKRGGTNLLAGRAWEASFFPLTYSEIPLFELASYLNRGGLPRVYNASEPFEELKSYVHLYLQEEVKAEALTRKIENFVRFLDVMALQNGEELEYQAVSSDAGVPARTIENYIQVLQDTLIGFSLYPFRLTQKRKAIQRAKFYFFDLGVVHQLAHQGKILPGSVEFGRAFEHWLILETRAHVSYQRLPHILYYWRSTSGFEVDLIIGNEMAVEFKATSQIHEKHLRGLLALKEEGLIKRYLIVSQDPVSRTMQGISVVPWKEYLEKELFSLKRGPSAF